MCTVVVNESSGLQQSVPCYAIGYT